MGWCFLLLFGWGFLGFLFCFFVFFCNIAQWHNLSVKKKERNKQTNKQIKKGNVLFNNALTIYLWLIMHSTHYIYGCMASDMVMDDSVSDRGNLLPLH